MIARTQRVVSQFRETEAEIPVGGGAGIEPCLNVDHHMVEDGAVALHSRKVLGERES
jgi:hypothetical protein